MGQYAHFYKCDLHMHSPMDHSWRDAETKLDATATVEERREAARRYVEACYDVGLEVVAVVDHNFAADPNQSLIPSLWDANRKIAKERSLARLIILPGFELECHVGRGGHVVCLFDPDTSVNTVGDIASKLLPSERFVGGAPSSSGKDLRSVLGIVQSDAKGLVIAAHPDRDKGLLAKETAEHWWRQDEFCQPELYAVELHKPPHELNPDGFLYRVLTNKKPGWERERPIGYLMSSDCKRLAAVDEDERNYVGWRFTWIKMSRPTVEGLRQAFLARDTHIRFGGDCPDDQYTYPKIVSVSTKKGFLYLADLELSPNLNCFIGGRGSGKSTLIDTIRASGDRIGEEIPPKVLGDVRDRLDKTTKQAEVEVRVRSHAGVRTLQLDWDGKPQITVLDEAGAVLPDADARTLFPARFLSQGEVDALAFEPGRVAKLLDDFVEPDLHELEQQEKTIRSDIAQLDAEIGEFERQIREKARVQTEANETEGKLSSLEAVEAELGYWQAVAEADTAVEGMGTSVGEAEQIVSQALVEVEQLRVLVNGKARTPLREAAVPDDIVPETHSDAVKSAEKLARCARSALGIAADQLRDACAGLRRRVLDAGSPFQTKLEERWRPFVSDADASREALKADLREQGLDPDEYESLKKDLATKRAALQRIAGLETILAAKRKERGTKVDELHEVWRERTAVRRAKADQLNDNLHGVLTISVGHQCSIADLVSRLDQEGFWQDKRRMSQEDWEELLEKLKEDAQEEEPLAVLLVNAIRMLTEDGTGPIGDLWGGDERKANVLREWFPEDVLGRVETVAVADEIDVIVCDTEGNPLGDLAHVSTGQRGFAVLSLMLAEGDCPLIIDTPEEGLDNEGVFSQLVPLLMEKKECRQLVIVTHNANIPVNADAELIVALEAIQDEHNVVHGNVKDVPALGAPRSAIGALDRKEVVEAVVDIMEGSQEAFARRRVKYGY